MTAGQRRATVAVTLASAEQWEYDARRHVRRGEWVAAETCLRIADSLRRQADRAGHRGDGVYRRVP